MRDKDAPNDAKLNVTILGAVSRIITSYVANNRIEPQELQRLISDTCRSIQSAVRGMGTRTGVTGHTKPQPAVDPNRSVHRDYLICLEDGVKKTLLRRYLREKYGLSPEAYRRRWNLPADYPMSAPTYSKAKSAAAKRHQFGRRKTVTSP